MHTAQGSRACKSQQLLISHLPRASVSAAAVARRGRNEILLCMV